MDSNAVHVVIWNGSDETAIAAVSSRFPGSSISVLSKRKLRESGWREQFRVLSKLRGSALVYFAESLEDFVEPLMLAATGLIHHCQATVFVDSQGRTRHYAGRELVPLSLKLSAAAIIDAFVLSAGSLILRLLLSVRRRSHIRRPTSSCGSIAYLYPFPFNRSRVGGAMTHTCGVLSGINKCKHDALVITSQKLPAPDVEQQVVANRRTLFLLRESPTLSYQIRFVIQARQLLKRTETAFIYQRHGAYAVAGAVLSRICGVPFVLEYNGSEQWVARHWDPCRFPRLLRWCEQLSIRTASLIVVVSAALKQELLSQRIPENRILVNPNGVDMNKFSVVDNAKEIRSRFGFADGDVIVGFLGTFSYWHGVEILQKAISQILTAGKPEACKVRFLLIGDGPLRSAIRDQLRRFETERAVVFTGLVSHDEVPALLAACDILVSPHIPNPDGSAFFGSPTKLFEYMAMGKAIVASNLDQIGEVLNHHQTALLVQPGSVEDLVRAIEMLASDSQLRHKLGRNAAATARQTYTWAANAVRLLYRLEQLNSPAPTEINSSTSAIAADPQTL